MNNWEIYNFEEEIKQILLTYGCTDESQHHFGNQFLSAYQIAIEFDKLHPHVKNQMCIPVGGKGFNTNNSLSKYIANQLSRRIKNDTNNITDYIEAGFLANVDLVCIEFSNNGAKLESSLTDGKRGVSIYRHKK